MLCVFKNIDKQDISLRATLQMSILTIYKNI